MNYAFIIYALGKLLVVLSGIMCIPAAIAFAEIYPAGYPDVFFHPKLAGFLVAIVASYVLGYIFSWLGNKNTSGDSIREGFAIVTFGWIFVAFFGSIPLLLYLLSLSDSINGIVLFHLFTDAYFENMSGLTTTGATILTDVESIPKGLLFWRSLTHWLGGMGIMTLALAVFPAFGVAAYQMFRGEIPGPTPERMRPQLAQTVKILWGVYALLTVLETMFLLFGGMSLFEALCHSFGTMATGGFSTRNASVGAWGSAYIEWVVIAFMFLAGVNFLIHYNIFFRGVFAPLKTSSEFRFYFSVMLVAIVAVVVIISFEGIDNREFVSRAGYTPVVSSIEDSAAMEREEAKLAGIHDRIRHSVFQVVSLTTTTGFCTADFDTWPAALKMMLVVLMFFGGCAGSTGGGLKMIRVMVLLKAGWREIKTMVQPRLIAPVKIGGRVMNEKIISNILGFIALFMILFVCFSLVMCLFIPDIITAVSSVVATMCNIGPGLGGVGAVRNYAWIPTGGKWILILCMLFGRLEIYTVLIVFAPLSWRK